jgi:hypothetical protein
MKRKHSYKFVHSSLKQLNWQTLQIFPFDYYRPNYGIVDIGLIHFIKSNQFVGSLLFLGVIGFSGCEPRAGNCRQGSFVRAVDVVQREALSSSRTLNTIHQFLNEWKNKNESVFNPLKPKIL